MLPDVPEPLEPDPDEPIEPEEPVEPVEPDEPLVPEPVPLVGGVVVEAEPPIVVPDELGVDELELELLPGVELLPPMAEPLLDGVELELPVLPLVCEPVAPEPALSLPLPQADRDITAAAMTARVAPREKEEVFMLNSLVGFVREDREEEVAAGRRWRHPALLPCTLGARQGTAVVWHCRTL